MTRKQIDQAIQVAESHVEAAQVTGYDPAVLTSLQTTSGRIRYLDACGLKRGQIAKILNKRYQHVRNVLITPVKKS